LGKAVGKEREQERESKRGSIDGNKKGTVGRGIEDRDRRGGGLGGRHECGRGEVERWVEDKREERGVLLRGDFNARTGVVGGG